MNATGSVFLKADSETAFTERDADKGASLKSTVVEGQGRSENWAEEEGILLWSQAASPDLRSRVELKWPFRAVLLWNRTDEPSHLCLHLSLDVKSAWKDVPRGEAVIQQARTICCSTWVTSPSLKRDLVACIPAHTDPLHTTDSHICIYAQGTGIFRNLVSLTSWEEWGRKVAKTNNYPVHNWHWLSPSSTAHARFPQLSATISAVLSSLLVDRTQTLIPEGTRSPVCCFQARVAITVHLQ